MNSVGLSPLALFLQAGVVGKGVMALLFLVSVWGWALILQIWLSARRLFTAVRAARRDEDAVLLAGILDAGVRAQAVRVATESHADRRWRSGESMTRAARALLLEAEGGLPSLAAISSTAPFVGLFGTVWGIMSSFASIADAHDTSLAVVAPGIAEALAAAAIGLAAAIPASVGYNRLSAVFSRVSADLDCLVQERADRLAGAAAPQAVKDAA
ncbi:Cell division and transport-associated protein TolQ [Rhodoblastus acidophilus]|uniref:Cell division and transport-associated protein TolQ n=1 Tax=Rhodoblastus acidophilus TaxID=1074 RepID=A0A212SD28_RHOAC|nr:MotA/TolQ/ExbB proton channel family protein [Rhodoblastus acidophilus]PPQ35252.1 flagellar motor protein MotA [Rhodoblastus acidophilus]RAI16356.1 flagellar motor protein MotA [Rhodoblastus acidophilus]SNB83490.1 Cell division and transport-associated protein TolQ [Rhodoblastus acidophilus]